MVNFVTSNFRVDMAIDLAGRFSRGDDSVFYIFAAKPIPYANDSTVEPIVNSIESISYGAYRNMIFGKLISEDDVLPMIRNIPWQTGKVFASYDHRAVDLETKDFYCVHPEGSDYHVFKCLSNNAGSVSTVAPLRSETTPDDEYYLTSDGYQWKFMFSVSSTLYNKFATSKFIPVVEDEDVKSSSVSGSIESIEISDAGRNMDTFASGRFTDVAVAGNNQILTVFTGVNTALMSFMIDSISGTITSGQGVQVKQGVVIIASGSIYRVTSQMIEVILTDEQSEFVYADGMTLFTDTGEAVTSSVVKTYTNPMSSNVGFYNGCTIYLSSGTGAGQTRQIANYFTSGNERRVLIDAPFDPSPSLSTQFEISPRVEINGDGTGASAIVKMDRFSNSVASVEILGKGVGYSYADVTIASNVSSSSTMMASLTAIISPPGGHGSNVFSELYATAVGIGSQFDSTDHTTSNDYRMVGIVKNPLFDNLELTMSTSSLIFLPGEQVYQPSTNARGKVSGRSGNVLTLDDVYGIFESAEVTGQTSGSVSTINQISRDQTIFDQRYKYQVEMVHSGFEGGGFLEDETVTQDITNASGFVHSVAPGLISLINVRGNFAISDDGSGTMETFTGQTSGAVAKLIGVSLPEMKPFSGDVVHIQQFSPINRQADQSERIKVILKV